MDDTNGREALIAIFEAEYEYIEPGDYPYNSDFADAILDAGWVSPTALEAKDAEIGRLRGIIEEATEAALAGVADLDFGLTEYADGVNTQAERTLAILAKATGEAEGGN